jgi:hypothetical protein
MLIFMSHDVVTLHFGWEGGGEKILQILKPKELFVSFSLSPVLTNAIRHEHV